MLALRPRLIQDLDMSDSLAYLYSVAWKAVALVAPLGRF
jgi:hypothetical protein